MSSLLTIQAFTMRYIVPKAKGVLKIMIGLDRELLLRVVSPV